MAIRKFRSGQSSYDATTYIGTTGTLFWDEDDGELRLSDGVTPGGVPISVRADLITAQSLLPEADNVEDYDLGSPTRRWHHLYIGDGGIKFNGAEYPDEQTVPWIPGAQVDDIIPATDNGVDLGATDKRFANIFLGYDGLYLADQTTDANINITVDNGTLYVDGAANLAIGNLIIRDTTLQSLTTDLDINIGETDDTGFFYIRRKAQFDNVSFSATEAMVSLNASGGADPATIFPDTVMQTVGRPNKNSRIIQRSYGSSGTVGGDNAYAVWASYAARGTTAAPAALKENDILARLSANGYGETTWGAGGGRVEFVALEDFTDTAKGTRINFWTTPEGQITPQNVASINSVGVIAAGIQFSGDDTLQTTAGIPLSAKAVSSATYVATLGVDGKLDATQIPDSLSGAIVFKGTWNANTNTPELSDSTPVGLQPGWEYVVEVGGTRDIGDGSKTFIAGDFVIYDGTHWKQVPSGNAFISLTGGGGITVNQSTGAITLGSTATPLSNVSTIVSRDSSGNFAANVITANLTGTVTGSVTGNAGTVTNGVYTTGGQTIGGVKTFTSTIVGSINGNAGTVTNGVYTTDTATVTNTMLAGSIANNKLANSSITVNGTAIALGASGTVTAAAGTLTGTELNSTVVTSSLTALGGMSTIKAGEVSIDPASIGKQTTAVQTVTVTGLTTSHKVVVTAGSEMPEGLFVAAAWVSATNTLSVNFHNWSGGVDAGAFNLRYFAWV